MIFFMCAKNLQQRLYAFFVLARIPLKFTIYIFTYFFCSILYVMLCVSTFPFPFHRFVFHLYKRHFNSACLFEINLN